MANNPGDPEAASMEVSETKLVNFAEKTKFDVSGDIVAPPPPEPKSSLRDLLIGNSISLVSPDLASLLNSDGTWNLKPVVFAFEKDGVVYPNLSDVPGLSGTAEARFRPEMRAFKNSWTADLKNRKPSQKSEIFQLDPNQLLSISEGFKVLLRRPRGLE